MSMNDHDNIFCCRKF